MIPECNCYDRAPTVPMYRDQFTHLPDCPCFGMPSMPVGVVIGVVEEPIAKRSVSAGGKHE